MNGFTKHVRGFLRILVLLGILLSLPAISGVRAAEIEGGPDSQGRQGTAAPLETGNYSSLPALLDRIGQDAMGKFQDFFDASPLLVEPFAVLGEFPSRQRISLLGVVLAEQMAAVLGNEALSRWRPETLGEQGQYLNGTLLEVDGYLRVQISGLNTRGERRSHVVNIEMSESIYRALHSSIAVR